MGANARMPRENPELSELEPGAPVALLKLQGIVDSSKALAHGVGAMNEARIRSFCENMVQAGRYKADEVDRAQVAELRSEQPGLGLGVARQAVINDTVRLITSASRTMRR